MSGGRRKRKSAGWASRQQRDPYVRQARAKGLRARSAFKLEQLDKKHRLIQPDSRVIDVGAAPGSWSQYVGNRVRGHNQVAAVDLLPMDPVERVQFVQGDFRDEAVQQALLAVFDGQRVDLVLSDMAPNITGVRVTDQANAEALQMTLLAFCGQALRRGGVLLTKVFEGEALAALKQVLSRQFDSLQVIKPDASRAKSREVYLLARGFREGG